MACEPISLPDGGTAIGGINSSPSPRRAASRGATLAQQCVRNPYTPGMAKLTSHRARARSMSACAPAQRSLLL
jgi:hypothetical protein